MAISRKDKLIQEKIHDPYYEAKKYPDGVVCPICHAIYLDGRWVWPTEEKKVELSGDEYICPACRRTLNKYPAGVVFLTGNYLTTHKEEILNIINNLIEEESQRSPLKRVINMEEDKKGITINLTDDHLARRIGEAIGRACKGELELKYTEDARFIRVYWHRDD